MRQRRVRQGARFLLITALTSLALGGCQGRCPERSAFRAPALWLRDYAFPGEKVAIPAQARACFLGFSTVEVPSAVGDVALQRLMAERLPDYVVATDDISWMSLRGQLWFQTGYEWLQAWRRIYPTAAQVVIFARTPDDGQWGAVQDVDQAFDTDTVALAGYQLSHTTVTPGRGLYLALLWDDVAGEDYRELTASVRVAAASTGELWYEESRGLGPTGWAPAGMHRLTQRYVVTPPYGLPQGSYRLEIGLRDVSGREIPVLSDDGDVRLRLELATVVHPPDVSSEPIAARHQASYGFGDPRQVIRLMGYDAAERVRPGTEVLVVLVWESIASVNESYAVFVHLLDNSGALVAQADGIPVYGFYPTSLWTPGDFVRDEHPLTLPPDLARGDYTIAVGLYDRASGARLTVQGADGTRLSDGAVPLQKLRVR